MAADCAQEVGHTSLEFLLRHLADAFDFPDPKPFLFTGSRRYGMPRPDSDWDWVWWMRGRPNTLNWQIWSELDNAADSSKTPEEALDDYSCKWLYGTMRFGPVNLLVVVNAASWNIWNAGTLYLLAEFGLHGPRTRERAIEVFKRTYDKEYPGKI